jgi:hypothetical protein
VTTISGASRYIRSATLANEQGIAAGQPLLLGGGASLLEAGRRINRSGIGLSSSARALNSQFVSQTGSQGSALLGLSSGASKSVADIAQQIKALRASLPASKISPDVLEAERRQNEENAKAEEAAILKEAQGLVKNQRGVSLKEYDARLQEQIRILKEKKADEKDVQTSFRRGVSAAEVAEQKRLAQEASDRADAEAKKRGSTVDTTA